MSGSPVREVLGDASDESLFLSEPGAMPVVGTWLNRPRDSSLNAPLELFLE